MKNDIQIPEGWSYKTLEECTIDGNVTYGIVQPGKHDEDGVPVIRVNNFQNGHLDLSGVLKVSPDVEAKYSRTRLKGGEVLLTLVGSTGQSVVAPKELAGWNVPRAIAVIRANKETGADWINLCLQSHTTQHFLDSRANTTVQKTLNLKDVRQIPILHPPKKTKAFVESCIISIDNKIQLNRQTNQTLEQMAQTLFKSWFVDFDPVIDNALATGNPIPPALATRAESRKSLQGSADNTPQLPEHIRALFPDSFIHHPDRGWIPEGWEFNPIGKVIDNVGGGTPKTKEGTFWIGGTHPFCTPKDMSSLTSKTLLETERHLTEAGVAKISSGQLPQGTVLMSSRAPIGYLAITDVPVSVNQGIIAMKPNELFSSEYILSWAEASMEEVVSRANGSTFLEISKKNFREIPFLIPSADVLKQFDAIAKPYFQRITSIQKDVDQLTKLRDTLLPKLISGELRLPNTHQPEPDTKKKDSHETHGY